MAGRTTEQQDSGVAQAVAVHPGAAPCGPPGRAPGRGSTSAPGRPAAPRWSRRRAALRRTPVAMWRDDLSDWAAALTYYAVLALLPALLMTVSLVSLVSTSTTDALIAHVTTWAPAPSGAALRGALGDLAGDRSAAVTMAAAGGVSALWSASSYLAVFRRALHALHGVEDQRPAWRKAPRIVLTALVLLALLVTSAVVLIISGPVAGALGRLLHLGEAGEAAWGLLKWPTLVCLVALLVLVLFRSGPPVARTLRHSLPGGILAALLWLTASVAFTAYAGGIGSYSRLYGSLAGVVVFLVWLWLSNLSLLAGAQFAVELGADAAAAEAAAQAAPAPAGPPRERG